MWQDLQNHIIERIHSKGFYIFDHKDGDPNAYLVPHNVEHFIYQGDFLKNLFEKIMVKLAIIYDLDNTVTQEIEDEKVKAVATLYDGLREHRTASHSANVDEDTFYMGQLNQLLDILGSVNLKALCNMVLDNHVNPYLEEAGEMLW
ncbi:hypothetical protein FEF33_04410 [Moraxella osloensis]|jgi:hypothetical protein|nr:hypothetical protein FEF33_04410 [Moraxella osloensis]RVU81248.1 hypothetical protein EOL70_27890 [Leucothrix sargassi]